MYDILHAPGTAAEVAGLERTILRWGPPARRALTILEPACGTGRYLRLLARRGHRVIGFDREERMVEYARGRLAAAGADTARVFRAEMTEFAKGVRGRVDAAFNLINTIRHLPSDRAMLAHLLEIRRVLAPGGVYLVGISLSAYGLEFPSEDVWRGRRGRVDVRQVVQFEPPATARSRVERVYSHLVIRRGGREEHRDAAYSLRCYSERQWRGVLGRAGLSVRAVVDDRGRPIKPTAPGYAVWVLAPAGKPGVEARTWRCQKQTRRPFPDGGLRIVR